MSIPRIQLPYKMYKEQEEESEEEESEEEESEEESEEDEVSHNYYKCFHCKRWCFDNDRLDCIHCGKDKCMYLYNLNQKELKEALNEED